MLGLYEFTALNQNQRANLLWQDGEFIANVNVGSESFTLYTIYMYFAEVTMDNNEITDVTPFRQRQRLEKYLNQINISDLNR